MFSVKKTSQFLVLLLLGLAQQFEAHAYFPSQSDDNSGRTPASLFGFDSGSCNVVAESTACFGRCNLASPNGCGQDYACNRCDQLSNPVVTAHAQCIPLSYASACAGKCGTAVGDGCAHVIHCSCSN